jgi:hypothetical protein
VPPVGILTEELLMERSMRYVVLHRIDCCCSEESIHTGSSSLMRGLTVLVSQTHA